MVAAAMKLKYACSWKKSYDQPRQHMKKQRHYFADKLRLVKAMVFPCVDVRVGPQRKLNAKELMLLNCGLGEDSREFWTAKRSNQLVLKKSVLIFIGKTDAEAVAPILWPPDVKN